MARVPARSFRIDEATMNALRSFGRAREMSEGAVVRLALCQLFESEGSAYFVSAIHQNGAQNTRPKLFSPESRSEAGEERAGATAAEERPANPVLERHFAEKLRQDSRPNDGDASRNREAIPAAPATAVPEKSGGAFLGREAR